MAGGYSGKAAEWTEFSELKILPLLAKRKSTAGHAKFRAGRGFGEGAFRAHATGRPAVRHFRRRFIPSSQPAGGHLALAARAQIDGNLIHGLLPEGVKTRIFL